MSALGRKLTRVCLGLIVGLGLSGVAQAAPIDVSYTVSGSAGFWKLDFTVKNNLSPPDMNVYFFGVDLPNQNIIGSPSGYDQSPPYNTDANGGPDKEFNLVWLDPSSTVGPSPGKSLSGFEVSLSDKNTPTSVEWFAFAFAFRGSDEPPGKYTGDDNFNTQENPGFVGVATSSIAPVPEPGSLALLGVALAGLVFTRRRTVN